MIRLSAALLALAAAPALAQDVSYELVNQTGLTLMELHASPTSAGELGGGDDILGAGVLAPGESSAVTIAAPEGECSYDFRSVFEDGSEIVETHDICAVPSYTVTQ